MNKMAFLGNKHVIHGEEAKSCSTMAFTYLTFEANLLSKEWFL